jgi:FixJ family two-component response regulator
MVNKSKTRIYVVDDDTCLLAAVQLYLEKAKLDCERFESSADCLERLQYQYCDLLVTDVQMPGMSGLELLAEIKHVSPWVPVIMMSSYGDIPLAVQAVKAGAIDFIEKPLEWDSFLALINSAISQSELSPRLKGKPLTNTETIILRLILQNKTNRGIADILHRSIRTVEVHRNHIMQKLNVHTIVDLVKRAAAMDLDDSAPK